MILEEFSAWFVWVIPLFASLFVPIIGKYSDKARNYFVVAIAAVTAVLALSLVPSVWSGNGSPRRVFSFLDSRITMPVCT